MCFVAYPLSLSAIIERLTNNYYRQKAALMSDIGLIASNCMTYNEPNSNISKGAKRIVNSLSAFVEDESLKVPVIQEPDQGIYVSRLGLHVAGVSGPIAGDIMNTTRMVREASLKAASIMSKRTCIPL